MNKSSVHRVATQFAALTSVAALAGVFASSAWAVPTLTDNGDGTITATGVNGSGANGLWFCSPATVATACTGSNYDYGNHFDSGIYQVGSQVYTPTSPGMVSLPAGTYNIQLIDAPNGSITLTSMRIGAAPAPDPDPAPSLGSGPAAVSQAFAAPASGSCDDVADLSLNVGGAPSGGWTTSWQQWVNDGTGGGVCQRTLTYSEATGQWVVAS